MQIFTMLNAEFAFDLDACANAATAKCVNYFDPAVCDALSTEWPAGSTVWCNPPYGRKLGLWVAKSQDEARRGSTVVMLLPSRTDTSWWHDLCMRGEIRFLRGRLRFDGPGCGRAPFPSAIVIFRPEAARG